MDIHAVLNKQFGFSQFRKGQEEVIRDVIAGENQIAILPTGSGKSLCFQLPAYVMEGVVLIISPLVALMEDQVAVMKQNGEKRVVALNSFLKYQERIRIIRQLQSYKFIFVSPEMLSGSNVKNELKKLKFAYIVIDEAHCISQWGFDFRPDYLRINEFLKMVDYPHILALTATADENVLQDIIRSLNMDKPIIHKQSLDRPNITYAVKQMPSEQSKTDWLAERLKNTVGPGIIYVASRKRADELANLLSAEIGSVSSYHAGMEQEDRAFVQEQFLSGEIEWICATNAFGMGIHKDNVRQVIHEHVPSTIANYIQEIGRAGRDGKKSAATLIYTADDIPKTRFIIQEDYPSAEAIRLFAMYLAEKRTAIEAAGLSGISETAQRVLHYYFERLSIEETITKINEQSRKKEIQLQQLIQLIQSNFCIREQILQFFGENINAKPAACCSVCGTVNEEWLSASQNDYVERGLSDWKKRLTQLLG